MSGSLTAACCAHHGDQGRQAIPAAEPGFTGKLVRLAREVSPEAMRKLIAKMSSADERVALIACQAVLERAWGKATSIPRSCRAAACGWISPD